MKYLHLFENVSDFNAAYNGADYYEPWVSYTIEDENLHYNKHPEDEPFTIEIINGGQISLWTNEGREYDEEWQEHLLLPQIWYSVNDGDWIKIPDDEGVNLNVTAGDKIKFAGENTKLYGLDESGLDARLFNINLDSTVQINLSGNIMSLLNRISFAQMKTVPEDAFRNLFSGYLGAIVSAENLILPATTLSPRCYQNMFSNCTTLTTPPALPATTLAESCYQSMFYKCYDLTTAPELPATTLADHCYQSMFCQCYDLTTAPELPAETLVDYCYSYMFQSCSDLNHVKCLAIQNNGNNSLLSWLNGVSTTGTMVVSANKPSSLILTPSGWTEEVE